MKIQLAVVLMAAVLYNIPKFAERHPVYYTINTSNNGTSDVVGIMGRSQLSTFTY